MEVNMKRLAYYLILFLTVLYAQPVVAMENNDPVVVVEQTSSEPVVVIESKPVKGSQEVVFIDLSDDSSKQENVQAHGDNSVVLPKSPSEVEQLEHAAASDEQPKTLLPQERVGEDGRFWEEKAKEVGQKVGAPQLEEAVQNVDASQLEEVVQKVDTIQILEKDNAHIVNKTGENGTFWLARLTELARKRLDKEHQTDKDHEEMLVMILKEVIKKLDPEFFKQCNDEYKIFKQKKQLLLGALFKQLEQFKTDFRSRSWLSNGMHLTSFIINRFDGMLLPFAYRTSWWLFLPLLAWKLGLKEKFPVMCTIVSQAWQESAEELKSNKANSDSQNNNNNNDNNNQK